MRTEKPTAPNATKENSSTIWCANHVVLEPMEHHIWKQKTAPLKVQPVTRARKERTRRPKVLPTPPIATIVPRANIPRKKEIPRNANATIVKQIHLAPNLDETNRVTCVKKERHQRKVLPFVLAVMLVPIYV